MSDAHKFPNDSETTEPSKAGKSREEIYLELAKLSQQSFQNRQSYEWKIAFGLWTAIGSVTYFLTQTGAAASSCLSVLAAAYVIIALIWMLIWQPTLHHANVADKAWKHYYAHLAEGRPEGRRAPDPRPDNSKTSWKKQQIERWKELIHPWPWIQSIPTLVFLFLSFMIIQGTSSQATVGEKKDTISVSGSVSGDNVAKVIDKLVK